MACFINHTGKPSTTQVFLSDVGLGLAEYMKVTNSIDTDHIMFSMMDVLPTDLHFGINNKLIDSSGDIKLFTKTREFGTHGRYVYTEVEYDSPFKYSPQQLVYLTAETILDISNGKFPYMVGKKIFSKHDVSRGVTGTRTKTPKFMGTHNIIENPHMLGDFAMDDNTITVKDKSTYEQQFFKYVEETFPSLYQNLLNSIKGRYSEHFKSTSTDPALNKKMNYIVLAQLNKDNTYFQNYYMEQFSRLTAKNTKFPRPLFSISPEQTKVEGIIKEMDTKVKFKGSPDGTIDPLTGEKNTFHEYTNTSTNKTIEHSVTGELNKTNPFTLWANILLTIEDRIGTPFEAKLGTDPAKGRWHAFISDDALSILQDAKLGKKKSVNVFKELDNDDTKSKYSNLNLTDILLAYVKAALNNDREALVKNVLDKITNPLDKKKVSLAFDGLLPDGSPGITAVGETEIRKAKLKTTVYRLRKTGFGKMSGTYLHNTIQCLMLTPDLDPVKIAAYPEYMEALEDMKRMGVTQVAKPEPMIDGKANPALHFWNIRQQLIKLNHNFAILAAGKHATKDSTDFVMHIENSVYTDEFKTFAYAYTKDYANIGNQPDKELASKIDVTVTFPDGTVYIIDIKTTSRVNATPKFYNSHGFNHSVSSGGFNSQEGYPMWEQTKHNKQLNAYRKILITRGVMPNKIETFILPVVVDSVDTLEMLGPDETMADRINQVTIPEIEERFSGTGLGILINGNRLHEDNINKIRIDKNIGRPTSKMIDENYTKELDNAKEAGIKYLDGASEKSRSEITSNIKLFIEKKKREVNDDKTISKEEKERRKTLITDLENAVTTNVDDMLSILDFVRYAHFELLDMNIGTDDNPVHHKGLLHIIHDLSSEYEKDLERLGSKEASNTYLPEVQNIYDMTSAFDIINDINTYFNSLPTSLKELATDEDLAMITEAKNAAEQVKTQYKAVSYRMLGKVYYQYADSNINQQYHDAIRVEIKRGMEERQFTQDDYDQYRKLLEEYDNVGDVVDSPGLKNIHKLHNLYSDIYVTEEQIIKELKVLDKDVNVTASKWLPMAMQSDKTIQLFFKMFKTKVTEAEQKTRLQAQEMDGEFRKYMEAMKGSASRYDVNTIYKPLLEKKKVIRRNKDTEAYEEVEIFQFIEEFDTDYKLKLHELKQAYYDAKDRNHRKDMVAASEARSKWEDENLHRLFKDEVYDLEKVLSTEARAARDEVQGKIDAISDLYPEANQIEYDPSDIRKLRILFHEKQMLSSVFDGDSVRKTGKELAIAENLQKYTKLKNKYYKKSLDQKKFAAADRNAKAQFGKDSSAYALWLDNNSDITYSEAYIERSSRISSELGILRTIKQLTVDRGTSKGNADLLAALVEFENDAAFYNHKEFLEKKNELIENIGALDDDRKILAEISKPYMFNRTEFLQEEVSAQMKAFEKVIEDTNNRLYKSINKIKKYNPTFDEYAGFSDRYYKLNRERNELSKFVTTTEYNQILEQVMFEYKEDYKDSDWYVNNHIEVIVGRDKDGLKKEMRPLRIWSESMPNEHELGRIDLHIVNGIKALAEYASENAALAIEHEVEEKNIEDVINQVLEKHFDDDVDFTLTNPQLNFINRITKRPAKKGEEAKVSDSILVHENDHSTRAPNFMYQRTEVRDEYKKSGAELADITFADGTAKPLDSWKNPEHKKMMNNTSAQGVGISDFHKYITELYTKQQALYPESKRVGMIIPSILKGTKEILTNSDNRKNKAVQAWERTKEIFTTSKEDEDTDGTDDLFGKAYDSNRISVPIYYTQEMDANEVSLDIMSSMMKMVNSSNKYQSVNEIMNEIKMTSTLFAIREKEGKVTLTDSLGRRLVNTMAKQVGLEGDFKYQKMSTESNLSLMFNKFIEMQVKGRQNVPTQMGNFRVDKVIDSLQGLSSFSTIGGLTPLGMIKGGVNAMQARIALNVEAWGGEYFDRGTLFRARNSTYMRLFASDMFKDRSYKMTKNGVVNVSLSGQIADHYDPLQGNFTDNLGNNVSGGMIRKMFSVSAWFFNQYLGEYTNSMNTLFAMMMSHKVLPNGDVKTWKEYIKEYQENILLKKLGVEAFSKKDNDFINLHGLDKLFEKHGVTTLSDGEYMRIKKDFNKLTQDLASSLYLKDGKLTVKDGVNWTLGDQRDIDMRSTVHGITREGNGAYADIDKAGAQQHWGGRAILMYRKYLLPGLMRRFRGLGSDAKYVSSQEMGSIRRGYHLEFANQFWVRGVYKGIWQGIVKGKNKGTDTNQFRDVAQLIGQIVTFGKTGLAERNKNFTAAEVANMKKSMFESAIIISLALLAYGLDFDDDEDKSEARAARFIGLYMLKRLRAETNSIAFKFYGSDPFSDNYKLLSSPSALTLPIGRIKDIVGDILYAPGHLGFERYKTSSGIAEKGDLKISIHMQKLLGTMGLWNPYGGTTPKDMYTMISSRQ